MPKTLEQRPILNGGGRARKKPLAVAVAPEKKARVITPEEVRTYILHELGKGGQLMIGTLYERAQQRGFDITASEIACRVYELRRELKIQRTPGTVAGSDGTWETRKEEAE